MFSDGEACAIKRDVHGTIDDTREDSAEREIHERWQVERRGHAALDVDRTRRAYSDADQAGTPGQAVRGVLGNANDRGL